MLKKTKPVKLTFISIISICFLALLFSGFPHINGLAAGRTERDSTKLEYPRIETKLALLSKTARNNSLQLARKEATYTGINIVQQNSVDVIIEIQKGASLNKSLLKQLNGEVLRSADNFFEVRIPISQITRLPKQIDNISYVRLPHTPLALGVEYGTILSEGVNLTGGSLFHSKNLLGRGVKIAIIDVGFVSFPYAERANEFPEGSVVDKKDYVGTGLYSYSSHGSLVAEIVHDMAPKADLYLKRIKNGVQLENATRDAISQNVDIIVHSVGWVNTNFGDGTGMIADITKEATEEGILWVNAAGNSAQKHWEGRARDEDGDGWVEFAENDETLTVKVEYSSTIQAYLTWNDWPKSDKNFDFFLYDENGNLLSSSTNSQAGTQPPAESIIHSASSSGSYQLKISVPENYKGTRMEIFSFNHRLDPVVESSSVMAPGNVESVLTVGAINRRNWKDGSIEPFSSRGPTSDGRIKPDITSIDGVTTYLRANFLGTSAGAPYTAGAAALILSRAPDSSPEEIKQVLYKHAEDLGAKGDDNVYGKGKMRLIYKTPSASRSIKPPEDGNIKPGDKFTVTVTASMPLTLQGGMDLKEKVPPPFEIVKIIKPQALEKPQSNAINYRWSLVAPGETKEIKYEVLVPKNTPPGDYEFTGLINGNSVKGTTKTGVNDSPQGSNRGNELVVEEVNSIWNQYTDQVEYEVVGENVDSLKVVIYSSNGSKLYSSGWKEGPVFQWNLHDEKGNAVSNGIYISYVLIKGTNGEIKSSELNKTLVLR